MNLGTSTNLRLGLKADRRGTIRFPLSEDLTYKVLNPRAATITGVGKTLNIGSGGILFSTEEKLPMGRTVELAVNWPARLGGTCPLKFVAMGRVVRSEADQAVVRIERYEFKTRGTAGLSAAAAAH
jgi:hypothetical protein